EAEDGIERGDMMVGVRGYVVMMKEEGGIDKGRWCGGWEICIREGLETGDSFPHFFFFFF
ncbi:hypothetical protein, partial [Leuconostoc mesenteroides]|uniref:hypothetical protein n=1 Tax=Leuconostoc mesenteroides TaxID=1245 RepID=UPI001CBB9DF8